ncbi:MAG: type II toxin-antitoxin system PemK/MazF family toxin [Acidimicrobiales bacterium]
MVKHAVVKRGDVFWLEHPEWGRRPVLVLTRDAAIPVLKRVTIASISRTIRGIPTEVVLDEDDGLPVRCVVTLDNLGDAWKATLIDRVTTLRSERMREVCDALSLAVEC